MAGGCSQTESSNILKLLSRGTQTLQDMPPSLQYQTIKLCLDTATSFLLFAGANAPTYRGRRTALDGVLDKGPAMERFPFLHETFARQVSLCAAMESSELMNRTLT